MLTALEQHFLAHHYGWASAAEVLAGEPAMVGGGGPDRAWFSSDRKGIGFSMPGEPGRGGPRELLAHRLTFAAVRGHMVTQPGTVVGELAKVRCERQRETRRHWDAMTAIDPHWYGGDPTNQPALDAERDAHRTIDGGLAARLKAVVMALLPLHEGEPDGPADLIEWADMLNVADGVAGE